MGQRSSTDVSHDTKSKRFGLSEAQYSALREAMRITDCSEENAYAQLMVFLELFPHHLRPLMQPLFFQLGGLGVGETRVAWPTFVAGVASFTRDEGACTWKSLLQAWSVGGGDADVCVELAASLCFWSAHATARPRAASPDAEGADLDAGLRSLIAPLQGRLAAELATQAAVAGGSIAAAAHWLEDTLPMLPRVVGPRLAWALLGISPPPDPDFLESRVLDTGLALLLRGIDARLWDAEWKPLYRDWKDGRCFNALMKGTLHYGGLAVVVVRTTGGETLGAAADAWEDANGKFGGSQGCLLLAITPAIRCIRATGPSRNHMYMNFRNKHAPRGLGFGGQVEMCRLWLDADLDACHVLQHDSTYGAGCLLPNPNDHYQLRFDVKHLEVWGVGGTEALDAQAMQREQAEGIRDQARQVDRSRLLENDFDKEMFFGNTFKASAGARETN